MVRNRSGVVVRVKSQSRKFERVLEDCRQREARKRVSSRIDRQRGIIARLAMFVSRPRQENMSAAF
jgi:hypothetical protein